tara:strand:+ start:3253 stop:3747 length:495 start_codon:yes stop_codon:yes gene_type:complete
MDIVTPGFGLLFWTTITFMLLLFVLTKFAWKPILNAVKEREEAIDGALEAAEKAKKDLMSLKSSNEDLLKEARAERDQIMKEAREIKENTISEAKELAKMEASKVLDSAREQINNEKLAAMTEVKNQAAKLAIDMAEKVLRSELKDPTSQEEMVNRAMDEVKLN